MLRDPLSIPILSASFCLFADNARYIINDMMYQAAALVPWLQES
jgi:hypothetical protein